MKWTLYDPSQGNIDRVSFLALEPDGSLRERPVRACWNHVLGHYHEEGPEWEQHSQIGPDPEYQGMAGDYQAVLMAIWPTDDKGRIQREFLGYVEFKVWLMSKWVWRAVHQFKDWPPGQCDYQIRCIHHRPYQHYEVTPCRERVPDKLSQPTEGARQRISDHLRAAVEAHETAWRKHESTLIPYLPLDIVQSRMALHHGQQDYYRHIQKWGHTPQPLQPGMWYADGHDRFTIKAVEDGKVTIESQWLTDETVTEAEARRRATWEEPHVGVSDEEMDAMFDDLIDPEPEPDGVKGRIDQFIDDLRTRPDLAREVRLALAAGGR
jgi:hypothetical protein